MIPDKSLSVFIEHSHTAAAICPEQEESQTRHSVVTPLCAAVEAWLIYCANHEAYLNLQ